MRIKVIILYSVLFSVIMSAQFSWSHLYSTSSSKITVTRETIQFELSMTPVCVLELFAVDRDGDAMISPAEIDPATPIIQYYLGNKIKVLSRGAQLSMKMESVDLVNGEDGTSIVFTLNFRRNRSESFIIFCNVSEEADAFHKNHAEILMNGIKYPFVFTRHNYFDTMNLPEPITSSTVSSMTSSEKL